MLHFYWASSLGLMVVRWFAGGWVGENFLEDPSLPQRGNEKLAILNSLFIVPHDQLLVPGLAVNWTMQYCRSWFVFKSCLVSYDSSVCGLSGLGAVSRLFMQEVLLAPHCVLCILNKNSVMKIGIIFLFAAEHASSGSLEYSSQRLKRKLGRTTFIWIFLHILHYKTILLSVFANKNGVLNSEYFWLLSIFYFKS